MRFRLFQILTLSAWLLATGSHWDLVQTFAWGKMIASYSKTMPLNRAVQLTFSGDNLCGVCEFVAKSKNLPESDPVPRDPSAKPPLILVPAPEHRFLFASFTGPQWPTEHFRPHACARAAPPTEPPRLA